MAHIKDLHLNILQRVLAYFYDGVREGDIQGFKQLLPPAAVCRLWRECMLPYVYRIAYLECHVKEAYRDSETVQPECDWKSNIGLIVSQRLSSVIGELKVWSFGCPVNFADMTHALDAFGLGLGYWRTVNALKIDMVYSAAVADDTSSSSDNEVLATQLTQYFGRHVPNIGNLSLCFNITSNIHALLSNKLVELYISQLHSLYCWVNPITFNCHSFSSRLRYLHVGIASGVANRLPQLLASPLETLYLFDIPHDFAWWRFIGIAPSHIEFTNLCSLTLEFRQPLEDADESSNSNRQVRMSTTSFDIGHRMLYFPKLEWLHISNSPYNDGTFYSMFFHSPLQTAEIYNSFKSVQHMDSRILSNPANFMLKIHSVSLDDYNDYAEFYYRLLGTPCNVRTARLGVFQTSVPLPIPSTIEWVNLEYIALDTSIHLFSLIQVIVQLPKLYKCEAENVVDEVNEAGVNLQAILRGTWTQMQSIAINVKSLLIYTYTKRPLVFNLDVMRYLTIFTHSLDEVTVPDVYVSDIKEFAAHNANAFPHLRDIKVRGASWWYNQ